MTALTVIQEACVEHLGIEKPTAVFGQSDRTSLELIEALNTARDDIFRCHDWRDLATLATFTGDGSTIAFSKPTGYDRMVKGSKLWQSDLEHPLGHILSLDEWLELDVRSFDYTTGVWTILSDGFNVRPAIPSGETVKFYYISNQMVNVDGGGTAIKFANDGDTFVLDEELLSRGLTWRYLAKKGRPYVEEMADYEALKAERINNDEGFKVVRRGRQTMPRGLKLAYPKAISA